MKRLPQLPPPNDPRFGDAVKELLDIGEGQRGDVMDRKITVRDLVDIGLAVTKGIPRRGIGLNGFLAPSTDLGGSQEEEVENITPPPVSGFEVHGLFTRIMLVWDEPTYKGHAFVEVMRSDSADFGQALLVGRAIGFSFVDDGVDAGTRYYYWVRNVSVTGRTSSWSQAQDGETPTNPEWLLSELQGQITESQLYSDLNDRLDNLDNQFVVKLDQDGFMSGFGIAYEDFQESPFSQFLVQADRFAVINPATNPKNIIKITRSSTTASATTSANHGLLVGDYVVITGAEQGQYNGTQKVLSVPSSKVFTFKVSGSPATPATVKEGLPGLRFKVAAVPLIVQDGKVVINNAYITNLTANNINVDEVFAEAVYATDAKLDAAKINIADIWQLDIGDKIQSSNFSSGNAGFRLLASNGNAEFNDVRMRGILNNKKGQYIDFRSGVSDGHSSTTEGDFVLGDVSSGNYISFKHEPEFNKKVLRVRGDLALRNYTPGSIPLVENRTNVAKSIVGKTGNYSMVGWYASEANKNTGSDVTSVVYGPGVLPPGRNDGRYLVAADIWSIGTINTTKSVKVKGVIVTRAGKVSVTFNLYASWNALNNYSGSTDIYYPGVFYHVCIIAPGGAIKRVATYAPNGYLYTLILSGSTRKLFNGTVFSALSYARQSVVSWSNNNGVTTNVVTKTIDVDVMPYEEVALFADNPSILCEDIYSIRLSSWVNSHSKSSSNLRGSNSEHGRSSRFDVSIGFPPYEVATL